MDLWIRSQDSTKLIKAENIEMVIVYEEEISKDVFYLCVDSCIIGKYNTQERALEVLDEIQKLLIGDFIKFVNIDVDKDIVDYLNAKAIIINDPDCKQKVSFEHRDCIVYEIPEK